jgi:hypothetical protein
MLGDKAFGLLLADLYKFRVPFTKAFCRRFGSRAFQFGRVTNSDVIWTRPCPAEPVPGYFKFETTSNERDPFSLLGSYPGISSVIHQQNVNAAFSGAAVTTSEGASLVEGVAGRGNEFMIGRKGPEPLPVTVRTGVGDLHREISTVFGPTRIEWVYEAGYDRPWVVQLQQEQPLSNERIIVPGQATYYHRFAVERGLEALRKVLPQIKQNNEGVILIGDVGVTSHFGDILRRSQIPSRIQV